MTIENTNNSLNNRITFKLQSSSQSLEHFYESQVLNTNLIYGIFLNQESGGNDKSSQRSTFSSSLILGFPGVCLFLWLCIVKCVFTAKVQAGKFEDKWLKYTKYETSSISVGMFMRIVLTFIICIQSTAGNEVNQLCDTSSWNIIQGNWTYNSNNCTMINTEGPDQNILWFGSADGLTPDTRFAHQSFRISVTFEMHSGDQVGILFRTGECSTVNQEGPSYYVRLKRSSAKVQLGTLDDGLWRKYIEYQATSLSVGVLYNVTVVGQANLYSIYLDDVLLISDYEMTEFTDFSHLSFGIRSWIRFEYTYCVL